MTFDFIVIAVSEHAVQVTLEDNSPAFWLPRRKVEWRGALEPGAMVSADIPRWMALKHTQLIASRMSTQKVLDLHPVELDPEKANREGSLPMADNYPADVGKGFLSRDDKHEPGSKRPEFSGKISVHGVDYRLVAWVREKDGKRYFSLSVSEFQQRAPEQQQCQQPPAQNNTYAQAMGRDERQPQRPAGGPTYLDDDAIPFAPQVL
jgi:hypothetical protein